MKINPAFLNGHQNIKTIIFDWGGVITNIKYDKSVEEFKKLGLKNFDDYYTQADQIHLFDRLEEGKISPEDFRAEIRSFIPKPVTDQEIDLAWSSLLRDTPKEGLEILEKVKQNYETFLLSNTNEIHYRHMQNRLSEELGFRFFNHLFKKIYLSHEVKMRKPNVEIFQLVIAEQQLDPKTTLFIDDTSQHIKGAQQTGLHTIHLKKPLRLNDIFIS
jgi:putative hydrolase of the HAD superfamily